MAADIKFNGVQISILLRNQSLNYIILELMEKIKKIHPFGTKSNETISRLPNHN